MKLKHGEIKEKVKTHVEFQNKFFEAEGFFPMQKFCTYKRNFDDEKIFFTRNQLIKEMQKICKNLNKIKIEEKFQFIFSCSFSIFLFFS